jgi:hypothetical protein
MAASDARPSYDELAAVVRDAGEAMIAGSNKIIALVDALDLSGDVGDPLVQSALHEQAAIQGRLLTLGLRARAIAARLPKTVGAEGENRVKIRYVITEHILANGGNTMVLEPEDQHSMAGRLYVSIPRAERLDWPLGHAVTVEVGAPEGLSERWKVSVP